jgi:hypothetical protein
MKKEEDLQLAVDLQIVVDMLIKEDLQVGKLDKMKEYKLIRISAMQHAANNSLDKM